MLPRGPARPPTPLPRAILPPLFPQEVLPPFVGVFAHLIGHVLADHSEQLVGPTCYWGLGCGSGRWLGGELNPAGPDLGAVRDLEMASQLDHLHAVERGDIPSHASQNLDRGHISEPWG